MNTWNIRRRFLLSAAIVFFGSVFCSWVEADLDHVSVVGGMSWLPGLQAFAEASKYPYSTQIALLLAFLLGVFVSWGSPRGGIDLAGFAAAIHQLTGRQKTLYAIAGISIIMAPLFIAVPANDHQISSGFFRLVASNRFFFALFATSFFAYVTGILIFIRFGFFLKGENHV